MERDSLEGASTTPKEHPRRSSPQKAFRHAISIIVFIIVCLPFIFPIYRSTTYRDVRSGRETTQHTAWYIFHRSETRETEFSRLYRKYVSDAFPPPVWWYEYEEVHGLTTTRRGDNWDTDAFRSVEAMTQYESSDSEFAQPKAWKAFLKTFTSIFELPVEKSEIQRISERYFRDFEDRYSEQNLPLRPNDLPSLDEVRREVEKVER